MTFEEYPLHDSIRGWCGRALYFEMQKDERIVLITADLGYKLWDAHVRDFPDRVINTGASEQAAVGVAIGLALSGKIPFVYSISTFLVFRAYEWIRNYLDHERVPVRLVGSGIDDDYKHDGITHQAFDLMNCVNQFNNIEIYFPEKTKAVPNCVSSMIQNNEPSFLCLRR